MTIGRLTLVAALAMLVTGITVYALTAPSPVSPIPSHDEPSTVHAEAPTAPAPTPSEIAPAPRDTAPSPPTPSGVTAPSSTTPTVRAAPSADPLIAAATSTLSILEVTEAPGMPREGAPMRGKLSEGGTLRRSFTLTPGRCYAALAVGVGIAEIDVSLLLATPGESTSRLLVQDLSKGPSGSVGGKGHCYKWSAPLPAPAEVEIKATSGAGVAVGQLYAR